MMEPSTGIRATMHMMQDMTNWCDEACSRILHFRVELNFLGNQSTNGLHMHEIMIVVAVMSASDIFPGV